MGRNSDSSRHFIGPSVRSARKRFEKDPTFGEDGKEMISHVLSLLCLLRHRKASERKRERHHAIVDTTTAQDAASYGKSSIPAACIKHGRF